jgi:hypothetical protein
MRYLWTVAIGLTFLSGGCGKSAMEKAGASVVKDADGNITMIDFTKMRLFSDDELIRLAPSIRKCKELKTMDFRGLALTDKGMAAVVDILKANPRIEAIQISKTKITDKGAGLLLDAIKPTKRLLMGLSFAGTSVSDPVKKEFKNILGMYYAEE